MRLILLLTLAAGLAHAQANRRTPAGPPQTPPGTLRSPAFMTACQGFLPDTLPELHHAAALIADATVIRQLPGRRSEPGGHIETDVVLSLSRTFKGSAPARPEILVAELGGLEGDELQNVQNLRRMLPGERYLLFLVPDTRPTLPDVAGLPRFSVVAAWVGKARILGETVDWRPASTPHLAAPFHGAPVAILTTALERLTQP